MLVESIEEGKAEVADFFAGGDAEAFSIITIYLRIEIIYYHLSFLAYSEKRLRISSFSDSARTLKASLKQTTF